MEGVVEGIFSPVSSDGSDDSCESRPTPKKTRPKSMSFIAVRQAVYQLTCLNDFTLEKIGAGFFADVYKVIHKTTGEIMVLKMNKNRKNSKQMLAEIQLLNRLSHPNILKFKGSCVHEGQLHALTEFINGGTLEDLLENTDIHLSWSVRTKLAHDIASGMAYLHSKGVFHRDLTSKNCLIRREHDGTLTAVVSDFGLAAKIKHKRRSYTETVGSPYWMAPECLKGREYCEQADVFSYGIVLAEILTRVSADPDFLPRTQQFGVDWKLLRPMCEGCPPDLWYIVSKSCQMDPDDRPTFAEIVRTLEKMDYASPEPIDMKLKSSQSTPILSQSTSLVNDNPPLSPSMDLEAQLSSLLGDSCTIDQPLKNEFVLPHVPLDRDSGIDPGTWIKSLNEPNSSDDAGTLPIIPLLSSPNISHSHQASDSSDVSFYLPPPSKAVAPPSSPVRSCRASLSDPSSPLGSLKPSLSSLEGSYSSPEASPHIKHRKMSPGYFFCSCSYNHYRSQESILEEDSDIDKDVTVPLKSLGIKRTTSNGERCVCDKRKLILSSLSYSTPNIHN